MEVADAYVYYNLNRLKIFNSLLKMFYDNMIFSISTSICIRWLY